MERYQTILHGLGPEMFQTVIDNMYDEVLVYDQDYRIMYINHACRRHYSCPPDKMIGKSFFDFVGDEWWAPSVLPVVYREKKPYAVRQRTYLGTQLFTVAVPLFNKQGELTHVVMNVRDNVDDMNLYSDAMAQDEDEASGATSPIAYSAEMQKVMQLVHRMGQLDITCILTGESGTGKTMIARCIHQSSSRSSQPFISLNCASIPESLVESELFGYVRGAFTGANAGGKQGLFAAADHGTLFLDEVAELPLSIQAKLLHVLQEGDYLPVGSSKAEKTDARILTATNKNLKHMISIGQFREDLYYRLNVIEIHIPPLRKRREDIPALIDLFVRQFNKKYDLKKRFSPEAVHILSTYEWRGNVRELSHFVERLIVTVDAKVIEAWQLPTILFDITDDEAGPAEAFGLTLDQQLEAHEKNIICEAYKNHPSSRSLAGYLDISQSRASRLIRKYVN